MKFLANNKKVFKTKQNKEYIIKGVRMLVYLRRSAPFQALLCFCHLSGSLLCHVPAFLQWWLLMAGPVV